MSSLIWGFFVKSRIIAGLIAGLAISSSASATSFFDGFETDPEGLTVTSLNNFTVTNGNVDVVGPINTYGITLYSGHVIDLDGTNGPGTITRAPTAFAAGDKVALSFVVGGAQRGSVSDIFDFGYSFGGGSISDLVTSGVFGSLSLAGADGSLSATLAGSYPYTTTYLSFTALTAGSFGFSFGTPSSDTQGPLLDNVGLDLNPSAVPGPLVGAGLPGFIIALGALVALRRRRMAAT